MINYIKSLFYKKSTNKDQIVSALTNSFDRCLNDLEEVTFADEDLAYIFELFSQRSRPDKSFESQKINQIIVETYQPTRNILFDDIAKYREAIAKLNQQDFLMVFQFMNMLVTQYYNAQAQHLNAKLAQINITAQNFFNSENHPAFVYPAIPGEH